MSVASTWSLPAIPDTVRSRLWVRPAWQGEAGVRNLLVVGFPLIMSALSGALNMFFDRVFLSYYDVANHMSASLSGGVIWWWIQQVVMGMVAYTGTFVAQYTGADRHGRIGSIVWQAIYISLFGGLFNLVIIPLWGPFFQWVGHEGILPRLEADYCAVLSIGAVFMFLNSALCSFYTGRGKTRLVMLVNFIIAGANILLNWWLIFNPPAWLPFIHKGLDGAAWGTTISFAVGTVILAAYVFAPVNERHFQTRSSWRLDRSQLWRLVRFGFPQSLQYLMDMTGFSIFILALGRVDHEALTASTIAFNVNMLAFIPMVGLSQAISILTGQFIGSRRAHLGEQVTCSGFLICFLYIMTIAATYVLFPNLYINLFSGPDGDVAALGRVAELARLYLVFVAIYSVGDTLAIAYSGAIKGAGDTRFVMIASTV
ncbi:MATE family efflux transporter, partial [Candidatus Poribacteria bacterium]|nr:MATE family efflux transporter [Candidatus Poribacteria bacterium]